MYEGLRGRLLPSLCMALIGAAAIGGCGDADDASTASDDEPRYAEASEPPAEFMERMAKLLETTTTKKDCVTLEQISQRSFVRFPCPTKKKLRKSMASFKLVDAETYGTGAVVDYKSGDVKDGAAILLFVAPDRNWGVSRFGVVTKPSVGTSDEESREGFADVVDEFLTAVRERDCDTYAKVTFIEGASKKAACASHFPTTKELAKRLKLDPAAEPTYEGGNSRYGFFTLETRKPKPTNLTISVVKSTENDDEQPYVILDAAPSPTAAQQREVREAFRRQERERKRQAQPATSRSRKADS